MKTQSNSKPYAHLRQLAVAGAAVLLLLTACALGPQFNANGLPAHRYYVGGGLIIEYTAPATGTAYVVEETTEKILVTKSVAAGDPFEFRVEVDDPEAKQELENSLGKALNEARFSLYFIPGKPAKTE